MLRLWFGNLDAILRGDATRHSGLRRGRIEVPATGLIVVIAILGLAYGACMGAFPLSWEGGGSIWQFLATTLKVPALYFLTLLVTFPSLYVFNALVGSRLAALATWRLLVAALGVMLAVLSSLGPVVAFFSLCTTSHDFVLLLNVLVFGLSGLLGLTFLLKTLQRLVKAVESPPPPPTEAEALVGIEKGEGPGALESLENEAPEGQVLRVFVIWVVAFGLVGAQMGWVLSPFLGRPGEPFILFHARQSNFFEAVWRALMALLGS